jgi:5-methyltetrahydropteroyltriglutamate--homocysteine methyltransferase
VKSKELAMSDILLQDRPVQAVAPRPTAAYRADHVGSLLRPQRLMDARARFQAGEIGAEQLALITDDCVLEAIRLQEDCGLKAITDGEFRRNAWHMDFLYQIGGVSKADSKLRIHFHNDAGDIDFEGSALKVGSKLRLDRPIFAEAFDFVRDHTRATPKLTIPSPSMLHYRGGDACIDRSVYPEIEGFWRDLSAAYAAEIQALYWRGCRLLQLDDTSLAYVNDPIQREHVRAIGGDPQRQHLVYIDAINAALDGRPADMKISTHLCRGNFRSAWAAEGGYDYVADDLFNRLEVDAYFLEYDDHRSGGFEPLRFVPKGKTIVLGLISTKHGALESKDALKRRIDEASRFIDLEQVCISPQCGFSSTVEGNDISIEQQAAKLRLAVEVALEVWGEL